ncbi:MAG: hypothetical protein JWQ72_2480 [Polaromonas sp.]|nr:hypothetical protein [Polaromonas sp.]
MALQIHEIGALFVAHGEDPYGAEAVTQEQHALQCAHLAERAGAAPALIAAALLHDLGHLIKPGNPVRKPGRPGGLRAIDDAHQYMAIPFLRGLFPDSVLEPIRLHVDAKRYLCFVDKHYWASLSPVSQHSLAPQGGASTLEQARDFVALPFANDAVALRRWDDQAKDPTATPPSWEHYSGVLQSARRPSSTPA